MRAVILKKIFLNLFFSILRSKFGGAPRQRVLDGNLCCILHITHSFTHQPLCQCSCFRSPEWRRSEWRRSEWRPWTRWRHTRTHEYTAVCNDVDKCRAIHTILHSAHHFILFFPDTEWHGQCAACTVCGVHIHHMSQWPCGGMLWNHSCSDCATGACASREVAFSVEHERVAWLILIVLLSSPTLFSLESCWASHHTFSASFV